MWAPWRGEYLNASNTQALQKEACVFCSLPPVADDLSRYIIHRGIDAFVILNLYPYNNGHMLVIPYAHISKPDQMSSALRYEVMDLIIKAQEVLYQVYNPHGVNIGANVGAAAGAGIAGHLHFHILPRWNADANFMTTISHSRVIPEELDVSWKRIRTAWNEHV